MTLFEIIFVKIYTIVAVTAFASIGTSPDSTGEYCRTLFSVILISLMLSWLTAVTCTPLLCNTFLKGKSKEKGGTEETKDPYAGKFFSSINLSFRAASGSAGSPWRWLQRASLRRSSVSAM